MPTKGTDYLEKSFFQIADVAYIIGAHGLAQQCREIGLP